jgi:hypothetical protein
MNKTSTLVAIGVLAAGTFGFRAAGPLLRTRMAISAGVETLMTRLAVVLLVALVATTATMDGTAFAGFARPAGVLVGGGLAWLKAPFVVVVVAAAATAAGLRLLGVP